MNDRVGQVWYSMYHDEIFLILRSWPSEFRKNWITYDVLTLSSGEPQKPIHTFSEQRTGYWEDSSVMDRVL